MSKYSRSFIVKIYRFMNVCMDINELENSTKLEIKNLIKSGILDSEMIKEINTSYQNEFDKLKINSIVLLKYFHKKSIQENFYFFDCPFEVYKNHYINRKDKFLKKLIDSDETDFINSELQSLKNSSKNKIVTIKYSCINKFLTKNNKQIINFQNLKMNGSGNTIISFHNKTASVNYSKLIKADFKWKFSFRKKLEFLNTRLIKIEKEKELIFEPEKQTNTNKQLTINQAVILLDNLGAFSNPDIEGSSREKQSNIISLIMGRNAKNIKIALEKLNKKPSENGVKYQSDISKIDKLINNLKK